MALDLAIVDLAFLVEQKEGAEAGATAAVEAKDEAESASGAAVTAQGAAEAARDEALGAVEAANENVFLPDQETFPGSLGVGNGLRDTAIAADPESYGAINAGKGNTTLGRDAGLALTSGAFNVLIGENAGAAMTAHDVATTYIPPEFDSHGNVGNVAIGRNSMPGANGALDCTAVGTNTMLNATTCMDNSAFGINALRDIREGSENVAMGFDSLMHLDSDVFPGCHRNSALGGMAGRFIVGGAPKTGGAESIYIGFKSFSGSLTAENEIVIGAFAEGKGGNTTVIGSPDTTEFHAMGAPFFDGHGMVAELPNVYIDSSTGEVSRVEALPWTNYAPTITSSGGAFSDVDVTSCECQQDGKTVHFSLDFTITTKGTATGDLKVTLPVAPRRWIILHGRDKTSGNTWTGICGAGASILFLAAYNGTSVSGTGDGTRIIVNGSYEAA